MSDLSKEIANTVVRIKTEMRKASAKPKKDNSQADLFEDEGGRRYSRSYRRSKEKELREKRKSGGPKVMGKARSFSSRSEAGRYAANMRWRGRTGDLVDTTARDYATFDELTAGQKKQVERDVEEQGNSTGLWQSPEYHYKLFASNYGFRPPAYKAPGGVDRGRDILDNDANDNGDTVADLNSRYQDNDEYIAFEDLPKGGFREQVIAAFIDRKAAGYYDEPGRLKGPYDRPASQMTDKGYAKARAHALRGHPDGRESDLEEYWDDNSSVFWDEYDGTAKAYAEDVGEYQ